MAQPCNTPNFGESPRQGISKGAQPPLTLGEKVPRRERQRSAVGIVGVPMDLGAGRRGVDMGPFAIRYAGLEHDLLEMGLSVKDYQNIPVSGPESADVGNPRAKFDD